MFQCRVDFQFIALHIIYNFQHFKQIEYFNDIFRSLPIFQTNDCEVHIDLNDFPPLSKQASYSIFITNYVFLLEWKFWFYIKGHFEK